MREVSLKPRKEASLPPEKLHQILCRIYPEEIADKIFHDLTGGEPPNQTFGNNPDNCQKSKDGE